MWSYLYLAGYTGRLDRARQGPDFDDLVRANRAREDDIRRSGPVRAHAKGGSSGRAPNLRVVRYGGDDHAG